MCIYLFRQQVYFFISFLCFLAHKSYRCFLRKVFQYFIFLKISNSILTFKFQCPHVQCQYFSVLFVCMYTLYPVTLVSSLIFQSFLQISMQTVMSSTNKNSFISSFPTCFHFLSYLIALAINSSTKLNKFGENRYPCLFLNIRGQAFNLSTLGIMLTSAF